MYQQAACMAITANLALHHLHKPSHYQSVYPRHMKVGQLMTTTLTHMPYSLDQHILHTLLPSHTAGLLLTQLTKLLYLLASNHMLHIHVFLPLKVAHLYTQVSLRTHLLLRDHVTVEVCM